jgi:hypothetical protein
MPLKLNVGLSRKIGESNYGSRGASVNVELELDSSLVSDPAKLQDRVRQVFGLIRTSLAEELNGNHNGQSSTSGTNGQGENQQSNGTNSGKSNGQASGTGSNQTRPATQSQVRAIHAIAKKRQFDLKPILQERFRVARPDDLSVKDASALIDELNKPGNNGGG